MGKVTGFLEFERENESYIAPEKRTKDYKEFTIPLKEEGLKNQGARCMDCGIPFCHSGCPLGNLIPDFNDKVYNGKWKEAAEILTEKMKKERQLNRKAKAYPFWFDKENDPEIIKVGELLDETNYFE